MKNRSKLWWLSTSTFIIAMGLGGYTLIRYFVNRATLPDGVCPVSVIDGWFKLTIAFALVSFVLNVILDRQMRKQGD
jgi:hypothetical protein